MTLIRTLIAATLVSASALASAASVSLSFEDATHNEQVLGFYAGQGVVFSGTERVRWGTDFTPQTTPPSGKSLLEMYGESTDEAGDPVALILNLNSGFSSSFSLMYATTQLTTGKGTVRIFDGLDGKGNALGEISMDPNGQTGGFSQWTESEVTFSGTAKSVQIFGYASQFLLDDFFFGEVGGNTTPPGKLPEPSSYALMALAALAMTAATRRGRAAKR